MTHGEWTKQELSSGRARRSPKPGWHLCLDGLYRKDKPRCKDEKHDYDDLGLCRNCDSSLRPAEETRTGR